MMLFKRNLDKEKNRFYLLPGMGGSLYWKKQKIIITWSVIVGLAVSAILTALMYWLNHPNQF